MSRSAEEEVSPEEEDEAGDIETARLSSRRLRCCRRRSSSHTERIASRSSS